MLSSNGLNLCCVLGAAPCSTCRKSDGEPILGRRDDGDDDDPPLLLLYANNLLLTEKLPRLNARDADSRVRATTDLAERLP